MYDPCWDLKVSDFSQICSNWTEHCEEPFTQRQPHQGEGFHENVRWKWVERFSQNTFGQGAYTTRGKIVINYTPLHRLCAVHFLLNMGSTVRDWLFQGSDRVPTTLLWRILMYSLQRPDESDDLNTGQKKEGQYTWGFESVILSGLTVLKFT